MEVVMSFISHAKNFEDVILWRALRDVKQGFYIDIGAADPQVDSVTRSFYERGWSGINVQPLDEYFAKLTQSRPRDTNLKVAVGRQAQPRTLHAFRGTATGTMDLKRAPGHRTGGLTADETVVPVVTLATVLEGCSAPAIHFLKIGIECVEAGVLEGLSLHRFRPWIIVVGAAELKSPVPTRDKWEHLVTDRGYAFAYFDGLNCFYVADEVPELKERLAVPPNVFDNFVRSSEWSNGQKAATLEQELAALRGRTEWLERALRDASGHAEDLQKPLQKVRREATNLRSELEIEQNSAAGLRNALQAEQAQVANLNNALQAEQVQLDQLLSSVRRLETQLAVPSIDRALGRLIARLRDAGDQLTGGGVRALAKRVLTASLRSAMRRPLLKAIGQRVLNPFPRFSAHLYHLATASIAVPVSPGESTAASTTLLPIQTQPRDHSSVVNALYKAAFGRPADERGLANCMCQLESGMSPGVLAEKLVLSTEFQLRHGSSQEVDISYITALYRDGLGRPPGFEALAFWLAQGEEGATRAAVLAAVATSDEALAKLHPQGLDSGEAYARWVAANDAINDADRALIRAHIAALPFCPFISVIVPVAFASELALCESFNSILTQLYPYWELCVSANHVPERFLSRILRESVVPEPRIKLAQTNHVEDAAAATNAVLSLATGEFVTFLPAGDILSEHALYEPVFELGGREQTDIIYTDHDQIGLDGQRSNPWFKPGWDPDLLLAHDYISGLVIYRRTLIEMIGSMRQGFDGAALHDLALRATAATAPDRIRHIPAILYHRRNENKTIHSKPVLFGPCGVAASRRAVRDHLDARGDTKTLLKPAPHMPDAIRVVWPLPEQPPLVSVIIPTRDRADLLARCVDGVLHRTDYSNLELLIINNESVEPATSALFEQLTREENRVRILDNPGQFNYSAMNNAAAREARGEILLLLNNDIDVIGPDWLRELVSHAIRPDVGMVGAKLLYANELVQHAGVVLGPYDATHLNRYASRTDPGYFGQLALTRTLSAVTGACVAIRRPVFLEVGGFDEVNLPISFNDIDLCLKVGDYGYRVIWTPFAELFHLESASRGLDNADQAKHERAFGELQHLRKTWGALLASADPFHNPNLRFTWDYLEVPSAPRREKPWRSVFEQFYILKRHFYK
jgi:O-antigen biosynthesis protein